MDNLVENTTSKWGNKTLITIFASIVLGTNAFNAYIHDQDNNTNRIELEAQNTDQALEYAKERSDKKDERIAEQAEFNIQVNNYKLEIARLNRELKNCK
jgi:hypothetical protein